MAGFHWGSEHVFKVLYDFILVSFISEELPDQTSFLFVADCPADVEPMRQFQFPDPFNGKLAVLGAAKKACGGGHRCDASGSGAAAPQERPALSVPGYI